MTRVLEGNHAMSDSFDDNSGGLGSVTETTTEGWGSRLGGSLIAAVLGLILVPVAVVLLYWNEGRAVDAIRALNRGAASIVEVAAAAIDPMGEGKLVHLSGEMRPTAPARDPVFGVTADGLLRLNRKAEMYQWEEETTTHSQSNVGGSKTTEKTYTYKRIWADHPIDAAHFKSPDGHRNPSMPVRTEIFAAAEVRLGAYKVDAPILNRLSAFSPLRPQSAPPAGYRAADDGFYRGQSPADPAIGDVRVSFGGLSAQMVSVAAAQAGGVLTSWRDTNGFTIALAEPGVASAATLFADEKKSESTLTWILRAVGFGVTLIGFVCMTRPLTMLFAILPFLETIVGAGVFLVALALAVPVTLVTIAIAWIVHRPLIGIGLLVAGGLAMFVLGRLNPRRARARVAA